MYFHGACSQAQREAAAAQRAAERSRKEVEELASQQLPRTKAEFQVGKEWLLSVTW
jgi:hypothetical protein